MKYRLAVILGLLCALSLIAAAPAQQDEMTAGGAIAGGLALLLAALCFLALLVTGAALMPDLHERGLAALKRSPWHSLILGLINYVFFGALFVLFANIGVLGLLALIIGLALLALTVIGLAVVGHLVGEQLSAWRGTPTSPLIRIVTGVATLELALFVPVVGWFILLPLTAFAGLGAVVIGLRSNRKADAPTS
jgi:hypothetical protein